tara:strand:+ start:8250 stop:9302 length:1053 start_codon:yes stop_codon:yes gene_type:complete
LITALTLNPFRKIIYTIENISYKKNEFFFLLVSFLIHLLILIPMINFTFQKEISDIPMILPVEMFIVEEETAAPEFTEEINEIVPTMQEEAVEEVKESQEEIVAADPIVEEVTPDEETPVIQEVVPETIEPKINNEIEEVLVDKSSNDTNEFVIEEVPKVQKKEPEEETPPPIENDFEIELKQKPEPREIEQPFDKLEIIVKKKPNKKTFNVSTVLKDLENKDQEFKKEQETSDVKQEEVFTEKVGETMTISEIDLLKQQLHSCLDLNAGVANLKLVKPVLVIQVNPDRTVKDFTLLNPEKLVDPAFRTAAEAAMRAVNNPDCSPLLLPLDKYEFWKEITFKFDFSWMFD